MLQDISPCFKTKIEGLIVAKVKHPGRKLDDAKIYEYVSLEYFIKEINDELSGFFKIFKLIAKLDDQVLL